MNEIELTSDDIVLREQIEAFGEQRTEELTIDYGDRGEFELELDTGGFVSLGSLIDVELADDGNIESLKLKLDEFPSIQASVRRQSESVESDLPTVPSVDVSEIDVSGRRNFYERMRDSPNSQPAQIRRLIHEHQELNREEFDRLVEEIGYASDGGGVNMSLVVLENVTEEIERHGRGESQLIVWVR